MNGQKRLETSRERDARVEPWLCEPLEIGAATIEFADILPEPVLAVGEIVDAGARAEIFREVQVAGGVRLESNFRS